MVEHHVDDRVSFTITAFSGPGTRVARVTGPLGRTLLRRITNRYLRTLASGPGADQVMPFVDIDPSRTVDDLQPPEP
jgi:Domain of unknown function (DUF1990)